MSEQNQNAQQQTQDEQALQQARDFFGQSMGRILGQMESDNAQLQSYMQQLPQDGQNQVQQMTDSYNQFAGTITQAAQDAGVQDSVLESAQQAQEAVGDAADQAQDMAGQMASSLPEGYEALGQPFTDDQGNTILKGQDEEGNTAIVRRGTDEAGNTVDSIFDAQGNLLDENIVEEAAEEPEDVAGATEGPLPVGYEALGQPFTDDQGNTILQGQDEEGKTVIVRRGTDEEGNTVDSIFDAQGNLLDENIVE